eukprot:TRINITY_DN10742_c0_g1_i2.p1 TRINITY_DN10742_c0_g1~~TRINITY_DN10742_c0_g1_i2.p1  ORF type:complete len:119 (+),score=13.48 TRINITY_DN10742_c0_g1_i2:105-461(+)
MAKSILLIFALAVCVFAEPAEVAEANGSGPSGNACMNPYWNLTPLARNVDYESEEFDHSRYTWVIVFNFCRDTQRTCMKAKAPAFLNAPNNGTHCESTLVKGTWKDAKHELVKLAGGS